MPVLRHAYITISSGLTKSILTFKYCCKVILIKMYAHVLYCVTSDIVGTKNDRD